MAIGSIASGAGAGITSAVDRMSAVAEQTASGNADLIAAATDMSAARVQMAASVAVVRASNEMLGTLLDVMA